MVTAITEQKVDIDRQSILVWFGDDVAEDIWKCRFIYIRMANMAKTELGISIMVFIRCTTQEVWDMEEAELEKQRINHITPEILKKFQKKQRLPPMSYDTENQVLLTYSLFLKTLFVIKASHNQVVDAVRSGLLNMSEQEEMWGRIVWRMCFGEYYMISAGTSAIRFSQKQHKQDTWIQKVSGFQGPYWVTWMTN